MTPHYKLSCFPVVTSWKHICLVQISPSGEVEAAFNKFIRSCLLDGIILSQVVSRKVSFDIRSKAALISDRLENI